MTRLMLCLLLAALVIASTGCDGETDLVAHETVETKATAAVAAKNDDRSCGCRDVKATLETMVDFDTFTATGTVHGQIKGTVAFTGDPASLMPVTSDVFPPLNPETFSFVGQLDFTTKKGTFRTRGVTVFEAGPQGVAAEFHRIVEGTGRYADATGILFFNVQAVGEASFVEQMRGEICTPCGGEGD